MCEKCGCGDRPALPVAQGPHGHDHDHDDHGAAALLLANDRHAERNRGFFRAKRCFVLNLLSFGSSNAAALVARSQAAFGRDLGLVVVDAARLAALGAAHTHDNHAVPTAPNTADLVIPTIDAHMIGHVLDELDLDACRVLLIANSGSIVGQAVHDLGEHARAVVFSVREGERKPLKAPLAFEGVELVMINDGEAAAACGFDRDAAKANIGQVAPAAEIIELSAATGAGLDAWRAWLERRCPGTAAPREVSSSRTLNTEH